MEIWLSGFQEDEKGTEPLFPFVLRKREYCKPLCPCYSHYLCTCRL